MSNKTMRFGGRMIGIMGLLAGVAIALGLPAIVLIYGQSLGPVVLTVVLILSLMIGGLVAGVAAFFSLVMPSVVESNDKKVCIGNGQIEVDMSGEQKKSSDVPPQ